MTTSHASQMFFSIFRCLAWSGALILLIFSTDYAIDTRARYIGMPQCVWYAVPNIDAVPYSARFCYLSRKVGLLRLYSDRSENLVAERMILEPDWPNFYWMPGALGYNTSTGDAISIPPTLLDRIRARLP